jgi:hypothetical protein
MPGGVAGAQPIMAAPYADCCTRLRNPSKLDTAHLPCVEGVSEALMQQCIGASVFQVCITRPPLTHRMLPHRYLRLQS